MEESKISSLTTGELEEIYKEYTHNQVWYEYSFFSALETIKLVDSVIDNKYSIVEQSAGLAGMSLLFNLLSTKVKNTYIIDNRTLNQYLPVIKDLDVPAYFDTFAKEHNLKVRYGNLLTKDDFHRKGKEPHAYLIYCYGENIFKFLNTMQENGNLQKNDLIVVSTTNEARVGNDPRMCLCKYLEISKNVKLVKRASSGGNTISVFQIIDDSADFSKDFVVQMETLRVNILGKFKPENLEDSDFTKYENLTQHLIDKQKFYVTTNYTTIFKSKGYTDKQIEELSLQEKKFAENFIRSFYYTNKRTVFRDA